jgi:hypothetical protein
MVIHTSHPSCSGQRSAPRTVTALSLAPPILVPPILVPTARWGCDPLPVETLIPAPAASFGAVTMRR